MKSQPQPAAIHLLYAASLLAGAWMISNAISYPIRHDVAPVTVRIDLPGNVEYPPLDLDPLPADPWDGPGYSALPDPQPGGAPWPSGWEFHYDTAGWPLP